MIKINPLIEKSRSPKVPLKPACSRLVLPAPAAKFPDCTWITRHSEVVRPETEFAVR
jgi:competence transcription factor ComK